MFRLCVRIIDFEFGSWGLAFMSSLRVLVVLLSFSPWSPRTLFRPHIAFVSRDAERETSAQTSAVDVDEEVKRETTKQGVLKKKIKHTGSDFFLRPSTVNRPTSVGITYFIWPKTYPFWTAQPHGNLVRSGHRSCPWCSARNQHEARTWISLNGPVLALYMTQMSHSLTPGSNEARQHLPRGAHKIL